MEFFIFVVCPLIIYGLYWLLLKPKAPETQAKISKWL